MMVVMVVMAGPVVHVLANDNATTINEPPPAKKGRDETVLPNPNSNKYAKFDAKNEDWGSYYDPKNIFCGKYDCYKILGFDYESFGKQAPTQKEITQRYRSLSREWHPDKSKHRDAKELNDEKQKKEYDDLRYNQEAYFQKYGTSVLWSYAPKSDLWSVLVLLMLLINGLFYFMQYNKWQRVADRFIQAVVQEWSPREGGSAETKALREQALEILVAKQQQQQHANNNNNATTTTKKATTTKLTAKEKKRQEQEQLFPIVKGMVYQNMHDFGAGFHKPTWKDLFIVQLVYHWPKSMAHGLMWQVTYYVRRLARTPLSDDEKRGLTERAVGPIYWNTANEEQRQLYISKELWIRDKYTSWKEELEFQKLPAAEQKFLLKEKKRNNSAKNHKSE
jgi:DnaJ homolog subfamily C member 25